MNLLLNVSSNACVTICPSGYQNISWKCAKNEQTIEVISVSPNLFSVTDITANNVQAAVTTNKESLLKSLSAATGIMTNAIGADYIDVSSFGSVPVNITGSVNSTTTTSVII